MLSSSKVENQHHYRSDQHADTVSLTIIISDMAGMKQDKAGFLKEAFPWTGENETKEDDRRQ